MQASSERTPPVEWSQIMTTAGVQAGDYVTCEWLVCMSICVHHVYLCVCVCVCVCEGGRGLVRVHLHGDNYSDT